VRPGLCRVQGAGLAALRPLPGQGKERGLHGKASRTRPVSSIYCCIVSLGDGDRDGSSNNEAPWARSDRSNTLDLFKPIESNPIMIGDISITTRLQG
jgi:hypothetical protein